MTQRLTRREMLAGSIRLAAAVASVALLRSDVALAQPPAHGEDLVDDGDALRRGNARGTAVVATPEGPALRATEEGGAFTSATLQSSARFTHVGLHWSAAVPPRAGLGFEARTSADGSSWSPWSPVQVESLPEETPVGDYFGALIYAGGARFVQYRATFRTAGGAGPSLRRVTATVIDSPAATTAADLLPTLSVADADSGRSLAVTSREQWGADESYRFARSGKELWPEMFVPAKKLVVHHTATRNDYKSGAEAAAEVRAIYRYHAVTKRWGDIGYTALVDKFGNTYEGRHGRGEGDATREGREVLSAGVVAGHDTSHNYGSAGVALLGDATKADWPLGGAGGAMWDALVRHCTFESGRHFLRPLAVGKTSQQGDADIATSDFLRSDDTWTNGMRNISGHQETNATACPGTAVMGLLDELRTAIHTNLTDVRRAGVVVRTATREVALSSGSTLNLDFSWSVPPEELPEGWTVAGYEYCFEGWYKPSDSYDIQYTSGYDSTAQPRPVWEKTSATGRSFSVSKAGHYTLHVRALIQQAGGSPVRGAYEGNHTYLVKPASSTGGNKPRR
ncbi:MAG: N-acetylmuramoyl-L-alanine amidase [Chloroflexota bacterium]|nr:N-acetylmuramoyl-L-alanine amidase [Chloroflexota bacterium]